MYFAQLFPGIPGGIELVVIFLILLLLLVPLAVLVLAAVLGWSAFGNGDDAVSEERVAALEREVEALNEKIDKDVDR